MFTTQHNSVRLYNCDKTDITIVQHKYTKILGLKCKRQISSVQSRDRGSLVIFVKSVSPIGHFIPPLLVFPRKYMKPELMNGTPTGSIKACHPSGWIPLSSNRPITYTIYCIYQYIPCSLYLLYKITAFVQGVLKHIDKNWSGWIFDVCSWRNYRLRSFICKGQLALVKAILLKDYCMASSSMALTRPCEVRYCVWDSLSEGTV